MRDDHRSPPSVEQIEVYTTVNQSANPIIKDQDQVDPSTNEGSSDLPLGERSTEKSPTEALVNNTSTCVSDTRQDKSIMSSDLERNNDEHATSAIKKHGTDDELIIFASSPQQSAS